MSKQLRVMTYAELYGNIKKRPLKCGLGNKLISETSMASSILNDASIKVEKIERVGDTLSRFAEGVSPMVALDGEITSICSNGFDSLTTLAHGIELCPLYK